MAAAAGFSKGLKYLLEKNADLSIPNTDGKSPGKIFNKKFHSSILSFNCIGESELGIPETDYEQK